MFVSGEGVEMVFFWGILLWNVIWLALIGVKLIQMKEQMEETLDDIRTYICELVVEVREEKKEGVEKKINDLHERLMSTPQASPV